MPRSKRRDGLVGATTSTSLFATFEPEHQSSGCSDPRALRADVDSIICSPRSDNRAIRGRLLAELFNSRFKCLRSSLTIGVAQGMASLHPDPHDGRARSVWTSSPPKCDLGKSKATCNTPGLTGYERVVMLATADFPSRTSMSQIAADIVAEDRGVKISTIKAQDWATVSTRMQSKDRSPTAG